MGILSTLVGARLPARFHRLFKLPERRASYALAPNPDALLARMTKRWLEEHDGTDGVCRLDIGATALAVRLDLIELASASIDIQSYLVRDDLSGNLIALALLRAADRGVRVRLLMDDALTQPVDPGLLALGAHPAIEVRVFNPFPRHQSRFISFVANFNLLNRRMHNKSFTVDNRVTIVGGRNLADEYYQSSVHSEFLDEDLLAIGDVVGDVSAAFDDYWNTIESTPIEFLGRAQTVLSPRALIDEGERFVAGFGDALAAIDEHRLGRALFEPGGLELVPGDAELVFDIPDKVRGLTRRRVGETTDHLRMLAGSATKELIVVSPYFVPLRQGVELFGALVAAGVRVVIVTNSLASTNHSSVHAVYARYRKPLLKNGVELYELRPKSVKATDIAGDRSTLTLHSKVAVVDAERLFVGSFNLDPRSLYINTEMGLSVRSAPLASGMSASVEALLPELAYRLRLDEANKLRWTYVEDDIARTAYREPHTSIWRRMTTRLMGLLPIESQM